MNYYKAEERIEALVRRLFFDQGITLEKEMIMVGFMPAIFIVERVGVLSTRDDISNANVEDAALTLLLEAYGKIVKEQRKS